MVSVRQKGKYEGQYNPPQPKGSIYKFMSATSTPPSEKRLQPVCLLWAVWLVWCRCNYHADRLHHSRHLVQSYVGKPCPTRPRILSLQLPPPTSECSCTSTQRSCTHTARTRYPLYLCWFTSNWSSSLGVHQITCTVSVVDDWSGHQRHIHPEDDVMTVNWLLINCCGPNTQERTPTWLWEHGVENTLVRTAPSMNRKCLLNEVYGKHWYTHYPAWARNVYT